MTNETPKSERSYTTERIVSAGRRRTLVAPVILLIILALMTVFLAVNDVASVRQSRTWVNHSRDVIETTQELFIQVINVESGQRGFMLSNGDTRMLDSYNASFAAIPQLGAKLRSLVKDNPDQAARVDQLNKLIAQRVAVSASRVALFGEGRRAEAFTVKHGAGVSAMNGVRSRVNAIMDAETALLEARTRKTNHAELIGFIISLSISALAVLGLAWLIISMGLTNRDLSQAMRELNASDAARRTSEARYRAIFDNTTDLLSIYDVTADGIFRIAEVNPAFQRAIGPAAARYHDKNVVDIAPEPHASILLEQLKTVTTTGQPVFISDTVPLSSGPRIWETTFAPVRNAQGRIDRIVGSTRDVTEREQAQAQLRRAQRMEAIGHLTGGVAHDFNNLLQVIRGNLELLANLVEDREGAMARVKNALHGANRAAQLTRQLLAFARRQPLEPKVVNLGRLISDMTEMLRRTLGEGVEVETVLAGGLWNTMADPAQVESAVLNLAINARDAMPGGGRLTIEITNAVLDADYARREADIQAGQYVLLAVSDTGHGMDAATLSRVFEPFFTTKSEERGTGLGLSMVYGFVKQSNGHVQIYSELDQGTTVKIYLPRSRDQETVNTPVSGSLRGRSEVILVVEDDDMVRASAVSTLRDLGYTCIHASDGDSAMEVLKTVGKIDLLFTDVIMPGKIKSRELAAEAQKLRPGLPVLFTSGYTENAIVHHGRLDEGVQLLSKPYSREELARKIRAQIKLGRPVVLVVEDDPLVRLSAVDMVDALGFTPLEAEDAPSALKILNGPARVAILFTDIGLPGMRGHELAQKAREIRPELKVVFASGYGETEEGASVEGALQLGKPYEQDQLAAALGPAS